MSRLTPGQVGSLVAVDVNVLNAIVVYVKDKPLEDVLDIYNSIQSSPKVSDLLKRSGLQIVPVAPEPPATADPPSNSKAPLAVAPVPPG